MEYLFCDEQIENIKKNHLKMGALKAIKAMLIFNIDILTTTFGLRLLVETGRGDGKLSCQSFINPESKVGELCDLIESLKLRIADEYYLRNIVYLEPENLEKAQ